MRHRHHVNLLASALLAGAAVNAGEYVLNGVLLPGEWDAAMRSLTRPPIDGATIAWLNGLGFALGAIVMALRAVLRPYFPAPHASAIAAGWTAWLLAYVIGFGWSFALGVFSLRIYAATVAWSFVELPAAALLGAWAARRLAA